MGILISKHINVIHGNVHKFLVQVLNSKSAVASQFLSTSEVVTYIHCVTKKACDAIYLSIIRILIARL